MSRPKQDDESAGMPGERTELLCEEGIPPQDLEEEAHRLGAEAAGKGRGSSTEGNPAGWLFLHPAAVPDDWMPRSVEVRLVPLLPDEAASLLRRREVAPLIPAEDEQLVKLIAHGTSARQIASDLGMSLRNVERRVARLRRRFSLDSTAELAAFLAKRGF